MEDYGYMAPIIQSGAIGEVKEVYAGLGNPPIHCYLPEQPIPEGFDWDRWQGQAPIAPYNSERCSGNYGGGWRHFTEYGNGFLADWGAHKFGGAMYILGVDDEEPVELTPPGYEGQNTPARHSRTAPNVPRPERSARHWLSSARKASSVILAIVAWRRHCPLHAVES